MSLSVLELFGSCEIVGEIFIKSENKKLKKSKLAHIVSRFKMGGD